MDASRYLPDNPRMHRREFLKRSAAALAVAALGHRNSHAAARALPEPTAQKLPRWRGFNLLEKFTLAGNKPYLEQDFEWLAAWGFDFVRLPMDYRCWGEFHEPTLREIEQAVAWGKSYGVHVNLNFHHAPGYCVNLPKTENKLWTNPSAQDQFAQHWGVFAKRYKDIPSRHLSFDLVNEPSNVTGTAYAAVMKKAVDAIRARDPHRLIIADGIQWGTQPVTELIPLGIAQSTRGYEPMLISHYRAPWIHSANDFPPPVWPALAGMNSRLYGKWKPELQSALVLRPSRPPATTLSIRIAHVSAQAELIVKANGTVVLQKEFLPAPGDGEWKKSAPNQWGGHDADYDRDYTATLPAGTREVSIEVGKGDWLTFSEIRWGQVVIHPTNAEWGVKQEAFIVNEQGARPANPRFIHSKATLQKRMIEPWQHLAAQGVGVHVGEWGAFNHTPHAVTLAWMRDCLENWKAAGFGWALWNLRGSFGILDSDRKDVKYETFKGHKLDRQMLELLRRY